jgi:hypothetical protein
MLAVILKATPNLEELDCDLTFDYEDLELCDCEFLNAALKQVSSSLQSLILNFEILYDNIWSPGKNIGESFISYPSEFQGILQIENVLRLVDY